jgi:hypothetical protein
MFADQSSAKNDTDVDRMCYVVKHLGLGRNQEEKYLKGLGIATEAILKSKWQWVEAVATAFESRTKLTGDEFYALMDTVKVLGDIKSAATKPADC